MAILKTKCECGQSVQANVGDRIYNNRLYWFQSYYCDNCNGAIEMDGDGEIPPAIKSAILEQEGSFGLFLNDLKDRAKTEFLLKKIPSDYLIMFELFLNKRSDEIIRGTQNEVLLVKNYLKTKGAIDCKIK